jgi:hypothetical protein
VSYVSGGVVVDDTTDLIFGCSRLVAAVSWRGLSWSGSDVWYLLWPPSLRRPAAAVAWAAIAAVRHSWNFARHAAGATLARSPWPRPVAQSVSRVVPPAVRRRAAKEGCRCPLACRWEPRCRVSRARLVECSGTTPAPGLSPGCRAALAAPSGDAPPSPATRRVNRGTLCATSRFGRFVTGGRWPGR